MSPNNKSSPLEHVASLAEKKFSSRKTDPTSEHVLEVFAAKYTVNELAASAVKDLNALLPGQYTEVVPKTPLIILRWSKDRQNPYAIVGEVRLHKYDSHPFDAKNQTCGVSLGIAVHDDKPLPGSESWESKTLISGRTMRTRWLLNQSSGSVGMSRLEKGVVAPAEETIVNTAEELASMHEVISLIVLAARDSELNPQ